jgi:hypothetical protein
MTDRDEPGKVPAPGGENGPAVFDVERDVRRLKRSGHVLAVLLIALLLAFFAVVALSLLGYFNIQVATNIPPVVRTVYPVADGVPVFAEPTPQAGVLGTIARNDRVFEVQKVPGYLKIRRQGLSGWVATDLVKTKLEILGVVDEIKSRIELDLTMDMKWERRALLVFGTVVNRSQLPVKNIRVATYFLNEAGDLLATQEATIFASGELAAGREAKFEMRGADLMGKVATVSYEIEDFEAVGAPPPAEPPAEPLAEPPAEPSAEGTPTTR